MKYRIAKGEVQLLLGENVWMFYKNNRNIQVDGPVISFVDRLGQTIVTSVPFLTFEAEDVEFPPELAPNPDHGVVVPIDRGHNKGG